MPPEIFIRNLSANVHLVVGFAKGKSYPDPYEWVVTIVLIDGVASWHGFLSDGGVVRASQSREIYRYLRNLGCTISKYDRIKKGIIHTIKREF